MRIEHDAIADDRKLSRPHHAGRQQRQLVGRAVDDHFVAFFVPALKAYNDVVLLRQPIDNLALALIAPLRANHDDICHEGSVLSGRSRLDGSDSGCSRSFGYWMMTREARKTGC